MGLGKVGYHVVAMVSALDVRGIICHMDFVRVPF